MSAQRTHVSLTALSAAAPLTVPPSDVFRRVGPQMEALDRFVRGQVADFEPEIREMLDIAFPDDDPRTQLLGFTPSKSSLQAFLTFAEAQAGHQPAGRT